MRDCIVRSFPPAPLARTLGAAASFAARAQTTQSWALCACAQRHASLSCDQLRSHGLVAGSGRGAPLGPVAAAAGGGSGSGSGSGSSSGGGGGYRE
jgi:hypothetical protein